MSTAIRKSNHVISPKGVKRIQTFEGIELHPYLDKVGVPTIGWGTTHYETGKAVSMRDEPITRERADQLLMFELATKGYILNQTLDFKKVAITQNQYDALMSFAYNVGMNALLKSTLFRKLCVDVNDPTIAYEFSRWNKGTVKGKVIIIGGLTRRRKKESDLYFS